MRCSNWSRGASLLRKPAAPRTRFRWRWWGLLTALPGTALWRRLEHEGRLGALSSGDQFGRPNFEPKMDEETLLRGSLRAFFPERQASHAYSATDVIARLEAH